MCLRLAGGTWNVPATVGRHHGMCVLRREFRAGFTVVDESGGSVENLETKSRVIWPTDAEIT